MISNCYNITLHCFYRHHHVAAFISYVLFVLLQECLIWLVLLTSSSNTKAKNVSFIFPLTPFFGMKACMCVMLCSILGSWTPVRSWTRVHRDQENDFVLYTQRTREHKSWTRDSGDYVHFRDERKKLAENDGNKVNKVVKCNNLNKRLILHDTLLWTYEFSVI